MLVIWIQSDFSRIAHTCLYLVVFVNCGLALSLGDYLTIMIEIDLFCFVFLGSHGDDTKRGHLFSSCRNFIVVSFILMNVLSTLTINYRLVFFVQLLLSLLNCLLLCLQVTCTIISHWDFLSIALTDIHFSHVTRVILVVARSKHFLSYWGA